MARPSYTVDRLWPSPQTGLELDEAMAGFAPPSSPGDRPAIGVNMVTSIDGRAQRDGTAEGLASRADRRLMRLYRAAYDGVASGAGTMREAGLWLRVGDDLAERRRRDGLPAQPTGVLIAGARPVPTHHSWFTRDEPRILVVGAANPMADAPAGTELLRAPTALPEPRWVVERLAERGIGSLLVEGGPHLNAAFLAAGLIDELYWTIGAQLLASDALPMVAALRAPAANGELPQPAELVGVLRHGDELFLRYRIGGQR
jgi:riboflavin biosynthesis pyrimidine reductase